MEVVKRMWEDNISINLKLIRYDGEVWIATSGVLSLKCNENPAFMKDEEFLKQIVDCQLPSTVLWR
jgi:hypothetical protein